MDLLEAFCQALCLKDMTFYLSGVTGKKRNGDNGAFLNITHPESLGPCETTNWTIPNSQLSVLPLKSDNLVFAIKTTCTVCVR